MPYDKIQVALFFLNGFLISRLTIKAGLPEWMAEFFFDNKSLSTIKIVLYLITITALVSFFIPNVITVLTIIPVVHIIVKKLGNNDVKSESKLATLFGLAIIYGANIGGMGSLTGTPANGIMLTFMALNDVAGTEKVTFLTWFIWGIPLVIGMILTAWIVLITIFRPGKIVKKTRIDNLGYHIDAKKVKTASTYTIVYFLSSLILSALMISYPEYSAYIFWLTLLLSIYFILAFFVKRSDWAEGLSIPMLQIKDCYSNLPMKGFLFVGLSIVAAGIFYLFNLQDTVAPFLIENLPSGSKEFLIYIVLAIVVSFLTEFMSNTAVQITFLAVLTPLHSLVDFNIVDACLIVTFSSTCAFMSPLATGVNGLAFGGIKGFTLKPMLITGFIMNIAGAVVISLMIYFLGDLIF